MTESFLKINGKKESVFRMPLLTYAAGGKRKAVKGNMSGDASPAVLNGSDINIGCLIDIVKAPDGGRRRKNRTSDTSAPKNPTGPSSVKHGDVITGKSLDEIIGNFHSEINTEHDRNRSYA